MAVSDKNSFYEKRKINCLQRTENVLDGLPSFCGDFFVGIENNTSPLTRLNYANDLRIFFDFLSKKVLKKPEPYVLFQDFGASSLDFELRGYSSNIWEGWSIPSDLRFEINRRFIEEGIEIPFNQLVVHRGSEVSQETQEQFYAFRRKKTENSADEDDKTGSKNGENK